MQTTYHLLRKTPVAVVGMSSIFAQSKNLEEQNNELEIKINTMEDMLNKLLSLYGDASKLK